jgi:hypothetical protein
MLQTLMPGIGKYSGSLLYANVYQLPWGATERSVFNGASPAVANGDFSVATITSPGSYDVTLTPTGVVVIDTAGDTARQSFYADVYDVSLRTWYGQVIQWVNNALPAYNHSLTSAISVQTGVVADPVNFGATVTDADGDALTYTIVSGSLPPGLTLDPTTGIITGTPS